MYISYLEVGWSFPHVHISCHYEMPVTACQNIFTLRNKFCLLLVLLTFKEFSFISPVVPIQIKVCKWSKIRRTRRRRSRRRRTTTTTTTTTSISRTTTITKEQQKQKKKYSKAKF